MADAAMLSFPLPPRDFSPRTNPRTMRRPRTWQMFSFMRSRMRSHREVPTNPNFSLSLYNSYRYTARSLNSSNIEEIALPFVLRDICFFVRVRRRIFTDFVFNSVLKCKFTLLSTTSHSEISMNIDLHI